MNITSLNLWFSSVKMSHYRFRKKMELKLNANL